MRLQYIFLALVIPSLSVQPETTTQPTQHATATNDYYASLCEYWNSMPQINKDEFIRIISQTYELGYFAYRLQSGEGRCSIIADAMQAFIEYYFQCDQRPLVTRIHEDLNRMREIITSRI
jgi:hypothetical protein